MAKISDEFKEGLKSLSKKELEKIVLKIAAKDLEVYNYLYVNFIDTRHGEQQLYEQALQDLDQLLSKRYQGYAYELQLANMLAACNKRIDQFSKVCKNKLLEMELVLKILEVPFSLNSNLFTTCFTNYNYRVYLLLKKAIALLEKKIHRDFLLQYAPILNQYLLVFHRTSSHLDYTYNLKKVIELD